MSRRYQKPNNKHQLRDSDGLLQLSGPIKYAPAADPHLSSEVKEKLFTVEDLMVKAEKSGCRLEDSIWALPEDKTSNTIQRPVCSPEIKPKVNFKSPPVSQIRNITPSSQYPSVSIPSTWGEGSMSSDTWPMQKTVNSHTTLSYGGANFKKTTSTTPYSVSPNNIIKDKVARVTMGGPVHSSDISPYKQNINPLNIKSALRVREPQDIVRHHLGILKSIQDLESKVEPKPVSEPDSFALSGTMSAQVNGTDNNKAESGTSDTVKASENGSVQQKHIPKYARYPNPKNVLAIPTVGAQGRSTTSGTWVRPPGWIPPHLAPPSQEVSTKTSIEKGRSVSSQSWVRPPGWVPPHLLPPRNTPAQAPTEVPESAIMQKPVAKKTSDYCQNFTQMMIEHAPKPTVQSNACPPGWTQSSLQKQSMNIASIANASGANGMNKERDLTATVAVPETNSTTPDHWVYQANAFSRAADKVDVPKHQQEPSLKALPQPQKSYAEVTRVAGGWPNTMQSGFEEQVGKSIVQKPEQSTQRKVYTHEELLQLRQKIKNAETKPYNGELVESTQPSSLESQNYPNPVYPSAQEQLYKEVEPLTKKALEQAYGMAPCESGERSVVSNTGVEEKDDKPRHDPRGHLYEIPEKLEVHWDGTWGPDYLDWHDRPEFDDANLNEYVKQWTHSLRDMPPVCLDMKDPAFIAGKYGWYNRFLDHPDLKNYPGCIPNPVTDNAMRQFSDTTNTRVQEHISRLARRNRILRQSAGFPRQYEPEPMQSPVAPVITAPALPGIIEEPSKMPLYLRLAYKKDIVQIMEIFNHYVLNSDLPEDQNEVPISHFEQLYLDSQKSELPFIVAIESHPPKKSEYKNPENIVGFAFAENWSVGISKTSNGRSRYTGKVSLYVHPEHTRKTIGFNLMDRLLEVMTRGYTSQLLYPFVAPRKAPYIAGGGGKKRYHQLMIEMPYRESKNDTHNSVVNWLQNKFRFIKVADLKGVARSKSRKGEAPEFMNVAILQRYADHHEHFGNLS